MNNRSEDTCVQVSHGTDCPKVDHAGAGYLHDAADDGPYDVDGLMYCGRCHGWLALSIAPRRGVMTRPRAPHFIAADHTRAMLRQLAIAAGEGATATDTRVVQLCVDACRKFVAELPQ